MTSSADTSRRSEPRFPNIGKMSLLIHYRPFACGLLVWLMGAILLQPVAASIFWLALAYALIPVVTIAWIALHLLVVWGAVQESGEFAWMHSNGTITLSNYTGQDNEQYPG